MAEPATGTILGRNPFASNVPGFYGTATGYNNIYYEPLSPTGLASTNQVNGSTMFVTPSQADGTTDFSPQDWDGHFTEYLPNTPHNAGNPYNGFSAFDQPQTPNNGGGTGTTPPPGGASSAAGVPNAGQFAAGYWQADNGQWYNNFGGNPQLMPPPGSLGPEGVNPVLGLWQDKQGVWHPLSADANFNPESGQWESPYYGTIFDPQFNVPEAGPSASNIVLPDGSYMDSSGQWHNHDGTNRDAPVNGRPNAYNPNNPYKTNANLPPPATPTNCIAIRATGDGGEAYVDSTYLSLCGQQAYLGQAIPESYAAQEGARQADYARVFSALDTRIIGREDVHVDAEEGALYAKGEQEATFWSPLITRVLQQNIALGGDEFAALEFTPEITELRANINDLRLYSKDDVNIEGGDEASNHGNVTINAAQDVDIKGGWGADEGIGDVDILANNELTLISQKHMDISTNTTLAIQAHDWFRIIATDATEFSGIASNHIIVVKGNQETWIGRDEDQFSNKTVIDSAQGTTLNCNAADIEMLAGGSVHIEAQVDIILEGVNAYLGNDDGGAPWKKLVHEDFVINIFNNHRHGGVESGSSSTGLPNLTGNAAHMTIFANGN